MKLKRTKLAALAMSALMAVSAFSPYVYAEEETDVAAAAVEEATEEVAEEVAETEAIETEAAAEVVSAEAATIDLTDEAEVPAVTDAGSSDSFCGAKTKFTVTYDNETTKQAITKVVVEAYDDDGDLINTYEFTISGSDSKTVTKTAGDDNGSLKVKTFTAPTCKPVATTSASDTGVGTDGKIELEFYHTTAKEETGKYTATLTGLTSHTWVTTTNTRYVDEDQTPIETADSTKCIANGFLQTESKCSICGETSWTIVAQESLTPTGHKSSGDDVLVTWDGGNLKYTTMVSGVDNGDIVGSDGKLLTAAELSTYHVDEGVSALSWAVIKSKANGYAYNNAGSDLTQLYKLSGSATLINTAKNGYYFRMYTCSQCNETVYELVEVEAEAGSWVQILDISDNSNIAAVWIGNTRYDISDSTLLNMKWSTSKYTTDTAYTTLPAETSIELIDCTKSGVYYVEVYNESGKTITKLAIPVAAHHMEVEVAVFNSQEDMDKCSVSYDSNGNLLVTSNSCYEDITYTKEIQCKAWNCANCANENCVACDHLYEKHVELRSTETRVATTPTVWATQVWNGNFSSGNVRSCPYYVVEGSAETKTAEAIGSHTYLSNVRTVLNAWVKYEASQNINVTTEYIQENFFDVLDNSKTISFTYKGTNYTLTGPTSQGFKISDYVYIDTDTDTSTCTSTGEVTIKFICTTCGKDDVEDERLTVSVGAKGHLDKGTYAIINIEATCENEGQYGKVHQCAREGCDYYFEDTELKTIPRLKHTNEDDDYDSTTKDYTDDTDNSESASSIYLEFVGDKIVDGSKTYTMATTGASKNYTSLLDLYNDGITTLYYDGTERLGNTDSTLSVLARVYTVCENCGYEVDLEFDTHNDHGNERVKEQGLIITIDDVNVQNGNGAYGYITLSATFVSTTGCVIVPTTITGTFNYYTSATAYSGRVDKDTDYDPDVTTKNGVYLEDGVYKYYVNDEWATTFTGIIQYNDGYYFVANGTLCTDANGLNLYNGTWYMLAYGKIQTQYTGVAIYDGEAFYLTNGVLDTSVTGLVEYDGAKFLFCYGRLMDEVSGLWYYDTAIGGDGVWYYLAYGQVVDYTGAVIYDGSFFLVENGKLASSYTGTYEYDGVKFNVVNGQFYDQVA